MFRVDTPTAIAVMPPLKSAGTPGYFTEGGAGQSPTVPGADWFNMMQEEVMGVLSAAGIDPDKTKLNQLVGAISRLAGRGVTTVTSADSPKTLTVAEAGLVLVDASAGAVTLNLPPALGNGGLGYTLVRIDVSANAVAVVAGGTDTIDGAASLAIAASDRREFACDGVNTWVRPEPVASETQRGMASLATAADAQAFNNDKAALTPATLAAAFKGVNQSLASSGYQILPGGLILQWGRITLNPNSMTIAQLPIAYPNLGLFASATDGGDAGQSVAVASPQFNGRTGVRINSTASSANVCDFFAIGY